MTGLVATKEYPRVEFGDDFGVGYRFSIHSRATSRISARTSGSLRPVFAGTWKE